MDVISSRASTNLSQAGGSLKADSAGVWWCSMPFEKRTQYLSFIENQKTIESGWDKTFGDRKNEIVFIGKDMDQDQILSELNLCLLSDEELNTTDLETRCEDEWPVPRVYAL